MITLKKTLLGLLTFAAVLASPSVAFAHVAVKPAQVATAEYQLFTTSVPNERDEAVTSVRLEIPEGLTSVTPTVKSGWEVTTIKLGDNIAQITWAGKTIPKGFRDDFSFSAQAPANPTTLVWKAYQTYADGKVVSWDQKPTDKHNESKDASEGPYSTTEVVNEVSDTTTSSTNSNATGAYALAGVALVLAIVALATKQR